MYLTFTLLLFAPNVSYYVVFLPFVRVLWRRIITQASGSIPVPFLDSVLTHMAASAANHSVPSDFGRSQVAAYSRDTQCPVLRYSSRFFGSEVSYDATYGWIPVLCCVRCLLVEISSFVYAPNAPHYDSELLAASFDGFKPLPSYATATPCPVLT
eukprot:2194125-Rhodomonas_salina.4